MADNHNDDDDDQVPDFLATLVNLLAAKANKVVNMKKRVRENSGSSNSTLNALGKNNQKRPSKARLAGGPKARLTASKSSLSAGTLESLSPKSLNSPPTSTYRDRRIIEKRQESEIRSECDSISTKITVVNGEMSKAFDKQMVDLEKSYQEKVKFVATLKTICSQLKDNVKHVMGKENGSN